MRFGRSVHPHARGEHAPTRALAGTDCGSSPRTWGTPQQVARRPVDPRFIPTHVGNTRLDFGGWLTATVHPHARGEHLWDRCITAWNGGSSPRTWGTRDSNAGARLAGRFIPTHVGNTITSSPPSSRPAVHPHARGEHSNLGMTNSPADGSSPRTWGTRPTQLRMVTNGRFIPTHVGNTRRRRCSQQRRTVHPHARGEHRVATKIDDACSGSSPRTWGTPSTEAHGLCQPRFIPTHVGNTKGAASTSDRRAVHPHARGEHSDGSSLPIGAVGSSPRTWGTLDLHTGYAQSVRFIPTHVGNTAGMRRSSATRPVHPHARGEHHQVEAAGVWVRGSSPRTWGTPILVALLTGLGRFIPTHVGNTTSVQSQRWSHSVHPHARGEHSPNFAYRGAYIGSSPRTWGTLSLRTPALAPVRFIPTHVGNTRPRCWRCRTESVHPHARGEHDWTLVLSMV